MIDNDVILAGNDESGVVEITSKIATAINFMTGNGRREKTEENEKMCERWARVNEREDGKDYATMLAFWKAYFFGGVTEKEAIRLLTYKDTNVEKVFMLREKDAPSRPEDLEYRKAWTLTDDAKSIRVCVEKAKPLYMEKLRAWRNEKLKELDVEAFKGRDVQLAKQVLRDLPDTVDLSQAASIDDFPDIEALVKGK